MGRVTTRAPLPPSRRLVAVVVVAALALVAVVVAARLRTPPLPPGACAPPTAEATPEDDWVASWGVALQRAVPDQESAEGFEGVTLRQSARLSLGGSRLRIHLSNAEGDRPLVVGAATVARCHPEGGARVRGDLVPVTWEGRPTVSVPVGADVVSDPVALAVADGTDVLVSTWLPGPTGPVTWRPTAWTRTYVAEGDATRSPGETFEPLSTSVYFLEGVDVDTRSAGAVVALGDSITEGCCSGSAVDAHASYPDVLARRLAALPADRRMGVVNAGISSNQVLVDRVGRAMVGRFRADALERTDVRTVVLLGGVNDLLLSDGEVSPNALVAGYRAMVEEAHAAGVRVVGATILPYGAHPRHSPQAEATRVAVNDWIRTSGVFDAVADLDATTRDPVDPTRMRLEHDSGDGLHPSAAGYAAMGEAVRLADLRALSP